jgi:hypothetical protein
MSDTLKSAVERIARALQICRDAALSGRWLAYLDDDKEAQLRQICGADIDLRLMAGAVAVKCGERGAVVYAPGRIDLFTHTIGNGGSLAFRRAPDDDPAVAAAWIMGREL